MNTNWDEMPEWADVWLEPTYAIGYARRSRSKSRHNEAEHWSVVDSRNNQKKNELGD